MLNMALSLPTPRDWQEDELLARVLEQDSRAWAEMVRRYRPVMFRCISRVLGRSNRLLTPADCEEVYAEVLISLVRDDMRKLRLYDPARGARLGSWVGLLAKNAAHDYIRAHVNKPVASEYVDEVADLEHETSSPLDDLMASEHRDRLEDVLASYSAKDREFFNLYFARGLTVEEIALEMGISVKTVYTKKHKLLTRLASTVSPS